MAIYKILKIDGATITWSCKQVAKMIGNETLHFKNLVQRSFCWERSRMSELIWSILMGYPIPPIYAERGKSDNEKVKIYDVLDGQQRCTTIYKFLNDEFALTDLKPIPYLDENGIENEVNISGLKFSELDEELQDIIKDASITFKYFDNLEQYQKAEMFRRLNSGKPLSTKARTLASSKDIKGLLDIGSHKLFGEMLTEKAKENKNQAVIVMKAWSMLNQDVEDISFASKDFNPMIEETKISEAEKLELNNVFDFIVATHEELNARAEKKVAKKLYTETHLISLVPYFKQAMEKDISEGMMAEWIIFFFMVDNDSRAYEEYESYCHGGVARNQSIIGRHKALGKSYTEFFKVENLEKELTTTSK